jgi:hypothetical protein
MFLLIARFHIVIHEFKEISVFHKTDCFRKFVNTFMGGRMEAMKKGNKGMEKYCEMVMNASYGFDLRNNENSRKVKMCNKT